MSEFSGVSYLNAKSRNEQQTYVVKAALQPVQEFAVAELLAMLQTMFDGIDDSLFELANSARTNNEQNRFFEAMREIRIKRKRIESQFSQHIAAQFAPANILRTAEKARLKSREQEISLDSLSLVQNDQLEEDVAVNAMATKARANCQGSLLQLQTRVCQLFELKDIEQVNLPLDPLSLSQLFAETCHSLELTIQERLIVLKQFDRYVMSNLERVYAGANRILISQGVLPNLKSGGIKKSVSPRGESPSQHHHTPESSPAGTASETAMEGEPTAARQRQIDIFPHLQSLLAAVRQAQAGGHSDYAANSSVGTQWYAVSSHDLQTVLNSIQALSSRHSYLDANNRPQTNMRQNILEALRERQPKSAGKPRLQPVDEDLINLVSMLFEFILNDYNLAPSIQVLISRLQIPILKVVLQDRTFFNSNRHPARQLLNSMARAGIGWTEPLDPMKDALYSKIYRIVHRILDEFDGDISLFETLNEEFREFIEREEKKARIVEQRTRESETGRIRANQAQHKVDRFLDQLLSDQINHLPEVIESTLRHGWARVLFLAYLKDDQEHRWNKTMAVAEDLVWCATPPQSVADRQKWIAIVPKLLKDLKSGLKDVSYNAATLDETLNDIKQSLTNSFKNAAMVEPSSDERQHVARSPAAPEAPKPTPAEESAVRRQLATRDSELQKYLDIVAELEPGVWVEFAQANGSYFRCKLSTRIEEADCLIFVNRMGLKTREKSMLELADDLRKKQARILEQGPMIDRAIQGLMSSLRQKAQNSH